MSKEDKKHKKKKHKKKSHRHDRPEQSAQNGLNLLGERPDSQESVKSFGLVSQNRGTSIGSIKSSVSGLSFHTVAASEAADKMLDNKNWKMKKIFKRDADQMFKKMASTIELPTPQCLEEMGPVPTLKDLIYTGEILKTMYHRKEVQLNQNVADSTAKFYQNFKINCKALALEQKIENEVHDENTQISNISSVPPMSQMSNMSSLSKRPSEMNDAELQEQALSLRERLMLKSEQTSTYIETLKKYEEKEYQALTNLQK
jgi:hypothetical protein